MVGMKLDAGDEREVAERKTSNKLLAILDNVGHPRHTVISNQRSSFSDRVLLHK